MLHVPHAGLSPCLCPGSPQAPATLASHGSLLAALKGLSVVGRLLPEVFEPRAGEVLDFVVGDLLEADMSGLSLIHI